MSNPIQNFYKSTITNDWSIGTGNFYVSVKPTTSVGRLVVSPSSDTLREIIEYTSTGTDSNGDYIVVSARGVGGTTEQTHTVGEKVRMNITAEDWEEMRNDIDSIVAAGALDASTTVKGLVEIATDTQVIAGTDTGETGAKLVATPSQINTRIDTKIAAIPAVPLDKFVGVGNLSNTTYENYQILYGSANTVWNWTSAGSPTYSYTHILLGSAQGITRPLQIDLATGAVYTWASTKIKIIEWDAKIVADTSTATSYMGFSESGVSNTDAPTYSRKGVGFYTDASGNWKIYTGNGSNNNAGAISTPSAGRHTFRIEYNPATPLVTYYIDGTSVGTLNTYLPSSGDIGLSFSNGTSSTIISCLSAINIAIQK